MKFLTTLVAMLLLVGCGYSPASHYARNVVGESVSTEVVISMEDPKNTVIIKDAVDTAIITKFRTALVAKNSAKTHLKVEILSVAFNPLQYDRDGYVSTYRTIVSMSIDRVSEISRERHLVSGVYDFDIKPQAIISDQARFEAIRLSAQKALDVFVAQVAAQGVKLPVEDNSTRSLP